MRTGSKDRKPDTPTPFAGFKGEGEMRALCRTFDWSKTPLGPVEQWPQSLKTTAASVLAAGFPMILLWGPELIQLYNDGYRDIIGVKHPRALGMPTFDCWPEVRDINEPIYAKVFAGDTVTLYDALYRIARHGPDAPLDDVYLTITYAPVYDETDRVSGVLITFFETTQRVASRRMERERDRLATALDTERTRLAEAFRQAPSFLAILHGPQHVFTLINQAGYKLIGHRDVLNKPLFDALPDVRGQGFEALLNHVLETGEPFTGHNMPVTIARIPGAPPEERFIDLTYLPFIEPDGTRSGIIAQGCDITDHVHAQRELELLNQQLQENAIKLEAQADALDIANAELRASELKVRDVFEQAPLAVAVMSGPEHIYTIASPHYMDMLGNRPLIGLTIREAVPELHPKIFAILDEVYATARPYSTKERVIPLIDPHDNIQRDHIFDIHYQPLVDGRGEVYGIASTAVEVTLQVRARQEIEAAQIDAEQARAEAERARIAAEQSARQEAAANQAKSAFLATMSHELRTPINAIQGYTQLINMGLGGAVTDTQREYLHRLGTSAQHLLGVVNDILDLSKVDAGELTVTPEIAAINEAIVTALDLTMPQAAARNIKLVNLGTQNQSSNGAPQASHSSTDGHEQSSDIIWYVGDPYRVRQVLLNLLSNAVKFTDTGGTVTITSGAIAETPADTNLHGDGPWAFVRVEDTGIGIAPDQHAAVFEPFHQVEHGHTRTQGGTGLGLAISRRLARLMGGDLTLASAPTVGSTFTLWLPTAGMIAQSDPKAAACFESAVARCARAQRDTTLTIRGLRELGEFLRTRIDGLLDTYIDRLRADPKTPLATTMRRPDLEDHIFSFLADMAQALVIVDGAGPSAAALLSDSSAIQRAVAEAHGARRHAQGWSESALRHDYAIVRDIISKTVSDASPPEPLNNEALNVLLGMIDRAADAAHRAWRRRGLEDSDRAEVPSQKPGP